MANEEYTTLATTPTVTTTSGVSSYATTSTIHAYQAIQEIEDQEEKKIKETELNKTWKEISQHTTLIIISEAFLKYAPTFIFSVLAYSVIVNPLNLTIAIYCLIVFSVLIAGMAKLRSFSDEKSLYLARKQKKLEESLN